MKIMLDLNVVLDVIQNRQLHYQDSAEVLSRVRTGEIAGILPGHGITTLWYILAKAANPATANQTVDWLLAHFEIAAADKGTLQNARHLPLADYEDAVVTSLAQSANCDYIVTRNVPDFVGSSVPAITPADFLTLLPAAAREGLFCPAYVLMPDHLHLVWMGLRVDSDQRNAMKFLRKHLATELARRSPTGVEFELQKQSHDSVLREKDRARGAFEKSCFYVLDNPRRKGLVAHPRDWPHLGAVVPGYPFLHPLGEDFWESFWKLYGLKREEAPVAAVGSPANPHVAATRQSAAD